MKNGGAPSTNSDPVVTRIREETWLVKKHAPGFYGIGEYRLVYSKAPNLELGDALELDDLRLYRCAASARATWEITKVESATRFICKLHVVAPNQIPRGLAMIGNQIVQIDPDGSFVIPNAPALTNVLLRPRIVIQGVDVTLVAAPPQFKPPFFVVDFGEIPFHPVPKMPTRLELSFDRPVLAQIGAKARASVRATLRDETTVDWTGRDKGTTYSTSNPNVATVDTSGVVTARGAGVAFITANADAVPSTEAVVVTLKDPLTTVEGFFQLPDRSPAVGVSITVFPGSVRATTDSSGRFVVPGVASKLGNITVLAEARVASKDLARVRSGLEPVPGRITDAGILLLGESVAWAVDRGGLWSDASAWSTQRVPGPGDHVVIDRSAGRYEIVVNQKVQIAGLRCEEDLIVALDQELRVATPFAVQGRFRLGGGLVSSTVLPARDGSDMESASGRS